MKATLDKIMNQKRRRLYRRVGLVQSRLYAKEMRMIASTFNRFMAVWVDRWRKDMVETVNDGVDESYAQKLIGKNST